MPRLNKYDPKESMPAHKRKLYEHLKSPKGRGKAKPASLEELRQEVEELRNLVDSLVKEVMGR